MIELLDDMDWRHAFEYAGEEGKFGSYGTPQVDSVPGAQVDTSNFTREDVLVLYAADEGENDGPPWICYGLLKDGRYFYLEAGCDYTGWDCRAGGSATIGESKEQIERYAMTDRDRERLGVVLGDVR